MIYGYKDNSNLERLKNQSKFPKIKITITQALQLLSYLSNSTPNNSSVSDIERKILTETSNSIMWDLAEQLGISDLNKYDVDIITLRIKEF